MNILVFLVPVFIFIFFVFLWHIAKKDPDAVFEGIGRLFGGSSKKRGF